MSDNESGHAAGIDTLHDAFAELERRADARPLAGIGARPGKPSRAPMLLIAASVAVVLALAAVFAVRFGAAPTRKSTAPAGEATHTGDWMRPGGRHQILPPGGKPLAVPGHKAPPLVHALPAPRVTHPSADSGFEQRFAAAFHDVAGNGASYTVTLRPGGPVLVGQMTVDGVTGGFDIQDYRAGRGTTASCDDPDRVKCDVRSMPNGASLSTGSESLQTDPGGVTQQAEYVSSDGVEFVMHVSNAADPKGAGHVGPKPPLTIEQMVTILTSDRWNN